MKGVNPSRHSFLKKLFPTFILLSVFILYFFPVLFEGKAYFFRDIQHFAYPMKLYLSRVWALGEWPFWYPNLLQGVPLLPLMHPGVFYPLSVLFLIKDFHFAFHAYFLIHHLILMVSVYALCRYWGKSIEASLCASVTSLLGGYFLSLASVYNQFQTAVWFPLILMMWQKYLAKGDTKFFCAAVIFLSFQVLGGGPENAIFSVLLVFAHSLYLAKENGFFRISISILILVVLSLALSALQWVPTYFFIKEIPRGSGLDFATGTQWSLNPNTLLDLVLPVSFARFMEVDGGKMDYFIHSFYMGILPVFILLGCLLTYGKDKTIRFWLVVFGLGVFFALGKFNPLYSFFHEWVPIFNLFRFPQKFFFLCAFALVFLMGLSLDRLVNGIQENKQKTRKLIFALVLTVVGVTAIFGIHSSRNGLESLMILLLLTLAAFALYYKKIPQTKIFYFLLLLILMDLMGKNSMVVPMIDKAFYTEPPALAQRLGGTADSYRIYSGALLKVLSQTNSDPAINMQQRASTKPRKNFYNMLAFHLTSRDKLLPNTGTIYDLAYVDGDATMPLKTTFRWYKWFATSEIPAKKIILKRSNVKYWITEEVDQAGDSQRGINRVEVFEDVLPRAFLVGDSITLPEEQLLKFYYDPRFNPLKQVLLTESVPFKKTENFSGKVEELLYPPNKVKIKTSQNGEGFLVLLDTFFAGWKVTVDGVPQPILRANSFYRAVKLGTGDHNIEFSYMPVGLKMGVYISVCAMILILFMFFKPVRVK